MSKIQEVPDDEFAELVKTSESYSSVMKKLMLAVSGNSIKWLKQRIQSDGLDISHFKQSDGKREKLDIKQFLVADRPSNSSNLKARLVQEGILEDVCAECGIGNVWNGRPISLHLDHINGDHSDNRLENLQILCPNCHSQTETFGTRKNQKEHLCIDCGAKVSKKAIRCRKCAANTAR